MRLLRHITQFFETVWTWFHSYLIRKDHLVDCRSPENDYEWGYLEPAEQMFYSCFALLVTYIEKNKPFKFHYNPDGPKPTLEKVAEVHRIKLDNQAYVNYAEELLAEAIKNWEVGREMVTLYNWWKLERPTEHLILQGLALQIDYVHADKGIVAKNPEAERHYRSFLIQFERRDDEMFERLIKLRHHLWT
jgi:hypothetical protein